MIKKDFPGDPVVKNPLAGNTGSIPDPGRFHVPWGKYCARAQLLKPVHPRAHAPQREATTVRSPRTATRGQSRSLQLEKPRVQQQGHGAAKK